MQINEEVLKSLSKEYNLPVAEETYQDLGKSAYKGEHLKNELGLFLSSVKNQTVVEGSILVVYSLDRLSRLEIGHAKQTYYDLTNNGVSVYAIADNHLYRAHNAADDIISTITFERAHNESKSKSRRVIDASKEAYKRWKETDQFQRSLGRTPFWIDQRTNELNVNAAGVKKAVEMKLAGYGDLKIKQYLDTSFDYKPTRVNGRLKPSDSWDYGAISRLWSKRSLFGEKTFKIEGIAYVMENYYPPVIDENTFHELQTRRNKKQGRETGSGKISLLKSLARCGICGGAMVYMDKGGDRVNYVCNLALKGEHERQLYNANMLDLLTVEICKDAYLAESDSANNTAIGNEKLKLEAELLEQKDSRNNLRDYYKATPTKTFLDLIADSEAKIMALEAKLDVINSNSVVLNADELASLPEIFSDEVRTDYLHPERYTIRNNLYRFISSITLNRRFEPCSDAKTNFANCVDITWHFKNGQKRRLAMLPYEYTNTEVGGEGLYLPFVYMYGSKSLIKVEDGDQLLSDILMKLHKLDLTKCLYPSKGQYRWSQRTLECGKTYWVPLDEGVFLEPEALQFEFGGIHTEKSTPLNYISLMYSHLKAEGEYTHDYPLSKFSDLARGFNFAESYDFYDTLRDNIFDQELFLARDLLMS